MGGAKHLANQAGLHGISMEARLSGLGTACTSTFHQQSKFTRSNHNE